MLKPFTLAMSAVLLAANVPLAVADWAPILEMDGMLFPSYLVASATMKRPAPEDVPEDVLGDPMGIIGIEIDAPEEEVQIEVVVSGNSVMEKSVFKGTLEPGDGTYLIYPKIRYKFDELLKNKQARPTNVTITVKLDGEEAGEETETVTIRSINDCPFFVRDTDDQKNTGEDISWVFAAYVNEDHPYVDRVLKDALKTGVVDAFTGHQSGSEVEVLRQVYAIWHTLQKKDLKYSDISKSSAASDIVLSQHVRLMDESVAAAQSNCVDGSVLFASVLRKIGIEPSLVLVPGHCYLAFYVDREQKHRIALETTMIGAKDIKDFTVEEGLANVVPKRFHQEKSWASFHAAVATGCKNFNESSDKFDSDEDPRYQLISVAFARKAGVLPIAHLAK